MPDNQVSATLSLLPLVTALHVLAAMKRVGWVERSDTHQLHLLEMMGFAGSSHPTCWMVPSGGTALPHNSQPGRRSLAVAFLAQVPLSSLLYISSGTKSPGAAFWALGAGRLAGNIMLSRNYFVSQVTSLLKFAQETTDPKLAAVLIEKAADLKSQVDESSMTPAATARAPDVRPETSRVE